MVPDDDVSSGLVNRFSKESGGFGQASNTGRLSNDGSAVMSSRNWILLKISSLLLLTAAYFVPTYTIYSKLKANFTMFLGNFFVGFRIFNVFATFYSYWIEFASLSGDYQTNLGSIYWSQHRQYSYQVCFYSVSPKETYGFYRMLRVLLWTSDRRLPLTGLFTSKLYFDG